MKDIAIKVKNLYKSLNNSLILENINLEIKEGEKLCIVGGSGNGKSVLVKHFKGLHSPDKGRVLFYGKDLENMDENELDFVKKQVGYVFQHNGLFGSMNVYGNVSAWIRENPFINYDERNPEIEELVIKCLNDVGLNQKTKSDYEELLKKKPSQLSGGTRKRVAIAREIAFNAPLIIYDEPTSGLDPQSTGKINNLIDRLYHENKKTTIVITHDEKTMKKIGDRIVLLHDKQICFDGSYDKLINSKNQTILDFLDKSD